MLDYSVPFIRMLAALAAVIVLAVIVLKFLLPRFGFAQRNKYKMIELENRFALEPKKHLYLVRVAKRHFLLGSSEHSLSLITELQSNEIDAFVAEQAGKP